MKLYFIALLGLFAVPQVVKAQERFKFAISTAYQQDKFQWSVAGNSEGTNPNIYSELTWKNLRGPAILGRFEMKVWRYLFIEAEIKHSITFAGIANDTDYAEDNRVNPVFKMDLLSNKGNTDDYKVVAGYKLSFNHFLISPYLGYSKSKQLMFLLDKDIEELNTLYKTNWSGGIIGLKMDVEFYPNLRLETEIAYHQLAYSANANWNLIDQFAHPISFKHAANGFGLEADLKAICVIGKGVEAFVFTQKGFWNTGAGIDELFYENGDKAYTKLNKVTRNSHGLGLGLVFSF